MEAYAETYRRAVELLREAIDQVPYMNLIKEGTIKRFEFTHELAWTLMRDYLTYEGHTGLTGSRSSTRAGFREGLISQGQVWMDMIETRNRTVHPYEGEVLEREYEAIVNAYFPLFEQFLYTMEAKL